MSDFIIKSQVETALKKSNEVPIVKINFLGTGGAFDKKEKNSSLLISNSGGSLLIDCGFTVYPILQARGLTKDVKYIFITHCHEDHIGSLSTLVYHKAYVDGGEPKIETTDKVGEVVNNYLRNVCNHPDDTVFINTNENSVYPELQTVVHMFDTTDHHYSEQPTCGFVFNFRKEGKDFFIVYSGDINVPFMSIIKEQDELLYLRLVSYAADVFVFHEATARDYPPYYPHCDFKELEKDLKIFPNIFTYHHSLEEAEIMENSHKDKMKVIMQNIEGLKKELQEKLDIVKQNNNKKAEESLQEQADTKLEEFEKKLTELQQSSHLISVTKGAQEWAIYEQRGI